MTARTGFTLAEVLAALLILELALVGVAGIAATAGRSLADAVRLERTSAAAGEIADSLALAPPQEPGIRAIRDGWIRWEPGDPDGRGLLPVRLTAVDSAGRRLFELRTLAVVRREEGDVDGPGEGG